MFIQYITIYEYNIYHLYKYINIYIYIHTCIIAYIDRRFVIQLTAPRSLDAPPVAAAPWLRETPAAARDAAGRARAPGSTLANECGKHVDIQ